MAAPGTELWRRCRRSSSSFALDIGRTKMRNLKRLLFATVALIAAGPVPVASAVAAPSRTSAESADTGLLGPLSAEWWVWDFESPNVPADPVTTPKPGTALDPVPVNCALGQSGPVWYLAGT